MSLNNKVSPLEGERGEITYACSNKLFRAYEKPNGSHDMRRRFSEDDMIHLRRMSLDGVTGTSVFSTSSEVLGLALAAQELAAKTFKNGATFGFAITTPIKMTPQTVEQTQNDFIRNQSGILNAGKPPIMHSGTELQKISMTPEETQLLAAREHTDAEICRLLGVPHALLGIGTNGTSNTYKNLEQDMRAYVDSTLMKIISPLEELFNQRLLYDPQRFDGNGHVIPAPPGGELRDEYRFEFDTSALLRADKQARYQTYKTGIESKFLLPNEARAEEGFAPVEGGDEFPDLKSSTTVNVGQQNSDRKDPSEPETSPDEVEP